jgi:hypothetical protein
MVAMRSCRWPALSQAGLGSHASLAQQARDDSLKRHTAVWLQETLKIGRIYYSRLRADGVRAELDAMFWRVI